MSARETQNSIISSEAYWGRQPRQIPGCILPETVRLELRNEETGRFVRYISHEDGTYAIEFDPAMPPVDAQE